jgi:glycerol transport system ATP-binding protein
VAQVQDIGTYLMLTPVGGTAQGALRPSALPGRGTVWQLLGPHTCYYRNEELLA